MQGNLQGYISAQDAVDQIRLSLNSPSGNALIYILVEGRYDCCLYPKFFNESIVSLEYVGGGKGQVEIALEHLQGITKQVLGICDADFRHLEKNYPIIPNLFFTDCHDIEMTMLHSMGVLENILSAYSEAKNSTIILNKALELAEFPAYTRWYNERNIIKLDFERVGFGDVLSGHDTTVIINIGEYLQKLNIRSKNKTKFITENEIIAFKQTNFTADYYNLCNGHDVTAIIALFLGGKVSKENFCINLQISFKLDDFKTTKLYADIHTWQTSNRYHVLL